MLVFNKILEFYFDAFLNVPVLENELRTNLYFKEAVIFILMRFIFFPYLLVKMLNSNKESREYVLEKLNKKETIYNDTIKR